jgi:ATP-dependent Clp protease ATP-binding subunit ClpA
MAAHMGEVADHLIGHFVDQARRSGASWTDIGAHMGVTKQAAQKRFVPRESDDLDVTSGGRFRRFTLRARNVITVARDEAQRRGTVNVGNEHIVLGLLSEPDGLAAKAIVAQGVDLDTVHAAIDAVLGKSAKPKRVVRFGRGPKRTLVLALREALHLGHNYIGTEHILLGLLRNDDDGTAELLAGLGIERDATAEWIVAELDRLKQSREQHG